MMNRKSSVLFVLVVVALPIIIFSFVHWYEGNLQKLPYLSGSNSIGEFSLKNQEGKTIMLKDWNGKIIIANFFFTHCTSICPKMIANLKYVQNAFANDSDISINSFTVDPERDSVAQLNSYAHLISIERDNWNLLTGEKRSIYLLARKSFKIDATDGDGGPNDFIHSDKLVLVDIEKKVRGYYDGTNKNEIIQLIKDIKRLKRERN